MNPTILIGLGGIGSRTVDKIYGRISKEQQESVVAAALDTDANDLNKLKNLTVRIQTSPKDSVGEYVNNHREVETWFESEQDSLLNKMLDIGAGQIRCLSRLSFYSAIEKQALSQLDKAIEKLSLVTGSDYEQSVNVVVVGTIAGGTCSGSFIQMGLYLRDYFKRKDPNIEIAIQGVFLLPEILNSTGVLTDSEKYNTRVNAYAALKELHAILALKRDNKSLYLEYKPNSNTPLSKDYPPYNNIIFFDYDNVKGRHYQDFADYEKVLSDLIYYAYTSPLAGKYQSGFINKIVSFIENGSMSFYSGGSVAKLVYPYEDIKEYLSIRWLTEDIQNEWLKLDNFYQREMLEYRQDLNKRINRPKPNIGDIYIAHIDKIPNEDSVSAFDNSIFNQTRIINSQTMEVVSRKDKAFTKSIDDYILKTLQTDKKYQQYLQSCYLDEGELFEIDSPKNLVSDLELNRKRFERNLDKLLQKHNNAISQRIMSHGCDRNILSSDEKYNINHWLIPENEIMHPVAIRYFLYQVLHTISAKSGEINQEIANLSKAIKQYDKKYNIQTNKDTKEKEHFETATEVINLIDKQSWIDKSVNYVKNDKSLQLGPFLDKFETSYKIQVNNISKLLQLKLQLGVYEKVKSQLNMMIKNWEDLFKLLQTDLIDDFIDRNNKNSEKHNKTKKNIYLFSKPESKDMLWEKVKSDNFEAIEDNTLTEAISKSQIELFCKQLKNKYDDGIINDSNRKTYFSLLLNSYLSAMDSKHAKTINVSLHEAINLEKSVTKDSTITLQNYIKSIENLNQPWISLPEQHVETINFWGAHSYTSLGARTNEFDEEKNPPPIDVHLDGTLEYDKQFSNQELVNISMIYNLDVTDFKRFLIAYSYHGSQREGVYYEAYKRRMFVRKNTPKMSVTPHLDKRWDSPKYLPDLINPKLDKGFSSDQIKAFIIGVTNDWLRISKKDSVEYFYFLNGKDLQLIKNQGEKIEAGRWFNLFDALAHNPKIVATILERHEDEKSKEFENPKWKHWNDAFIKNIKNIKDNNIMNILITMLGTESKTELENSQVIDIMEGLSELLNDYLLTGYGENKETSAQKYTEGLKAQILTNPNIEKLDDVIKQSVENCFS